jgi:hypothetical protein
VTDPRLEDLYDTAPLEVLLTGGRHAGHRMLVPEPLPSFLLMPDPVPPPAPWQAMDVVYGFAAAPASRTTVYCLTGSIRDDGARVYEAQR